MSALSFQPESLDPLLASLKRQTTRPHTRRFFVGATVNVYLMQRRAILGKPLRTLTDEGYAEMVRMVGLSKKNYPPLPVDTRQYPAHFLGRVSVSAVSDIVPCEMGTADLEAWAKADYFKSFKAADKWFSRQYKPDWMETVYTVVSWNNWVNRYFLPRL